MTIWKRIITIILVSFACVSCDQGTKSLATEYLPKSGMNTYFNDIFRIGYIENNGAFLGLGNNWPEEYRFGIFVVAVGALLFGLLLYLVSNSVQKIFPLAALSLVFAGGVSNFYDRLANNGAVIDFLNIGFGSIRTGIFNLADMAIMCGMFLFVLTQKDTVETSLLPKNNSVEE